MTYIRYNIGHCKKGTPSGGGIRSLDSGMPRSRDFGQVCVCGGGGGGGIPRAMYILGVQVFSEVGVGEGS